MKKKFAKACLGHEKRTVQKPGQLQGHCFSQTDQPDQRFSSVGTWLSGDPSHGTIYICFLLCLHEIQGLAGVPTPPLDLPQGHTVVPYHRTCSAGQASTPPSQSSLGVSSRSSEAMWSVQRALGNTGQDTSYHNGEKQILPVEFMVWGAHTGGKE